MTLFAFCWVAVGYGIFQMLQIGTCASGGPYVSARECPDGIEADLLLAHRRRPRAVRRRRDLPHPRRPAGRTPARERGRCRSGSGPGCSGRSPPESFLGVWGPEANPGPGGEDRGVDRRLHGADLRRRRACWRSTSASAAAVRLDARTGWSQPAMREDRDRGDAVRDRRRDSAQPARARSTACGARVAHRGGVPDAEGEDRRGRLMATEGSGFNPIRGARPPGGDRARPLPRLDRDGPDLARPSRRLGRAGCELVLAPARSPATTPTRCFAPPTSSRR